MKRVLFVCVGNSCRSQMAKGFFNNYSKHAIADSAGTKPEDKIDSVAIQVMKEKNIDISDFVPKMFTFFMNNEFEYIVTMGCIDVCTISPKEQNPPSISLSQKWKMARLISLPYPYPSPSWSMLSLLPQEHSWTGYCPTFLPMYPYISPGE